MKKYAITGGPHSGKTSVLNMLSERGFTVLHETARLIIQEDQERKKKVHSYVVIYPWEDQNRFCRLCYQRQLVREKDLEGEIIFLDRSLVDNIAYAEVAGVDLGKTIYKDIKDANYEKKVFYFELIKGYKKDDQRKDNIKQTLAVHNKLREVYERLGYNVISVPFFNGKEDVGIKKRMNLILNHIE